MFCRTCGAQIADTSQFCPSCGSAQDPSIGAAPPRAPRSRNWFRRHPIVTVLLGLIVLSVVVSVAADAISSGSDFRYPHGSDVDTFNRRVFQIDTAWEHLRKTGNACAPNATAPSCFNSAITSSNIEPATLELRSQVHQMKGYVDAGPCRDALVQLEGGLASFQQALAAWRSDIATNASVPVMAKNATATRKAWDAAAGAENAATAAC
jgi:hypothetical protein